ncbi:hypothetical protein [Gimesia panareensis]|nr:hypothetical protein [Gimesia panareensis]
MMKSCFEVLLFCVLLLSSGCRETPPEAANSSAESQAMPSASSRRWVTLDQVAGLQFVEDSYDHESIELAGKRRHENPDLDLADMSEAEIKRYGELNGLLHRKMEECVNNHFRDTPVPEILQKEGLADKTVSPFTYQNWDWYGPSYECYLVVWEDALSSKLLIELQSLLTGDHRDWCIVVCTTRQTDFETNHEIGVFSDEVLIPKSATPDLKISRQTPKAPPDHQGGSE